MSEADFTNKTIKQGMTQSTGKLSLKTAETERVTITAEQQKQIKSLYEQIAKEIEKAAAKILHNISGALRQQYLFELQKQVNAELERAGEKIQNTIEINMARVSHAVVEDNIKFLESVGMPVGGAFSHVPDDIVRSVATGQLYGGDWTLSKAIWRTTKSSQQDIQTIIAKGIAENKSSFDIAKDLEKYVKPSAQKDWEWSKVYPGTARVVDYNAQRLARTMVSHAYQQSFVRTTKDNPFVTEYRWLSSDSPRVCPICEERDGQLFSKDDLPLDHPNGMCTFEAVILDSMTEIADRLADWAGGAEDPALDRFAEALGVTI